jgi:DNA topoisomerase-1
MLIRSSRFGSFLGCSGFPECRHTMQLSENKETAASENGVAQVAVEAPQACPNCGKPMQTRRGRFGEFLGCSGYPDCKTIIDPKKKDLPPPDPEFSIACPRSGCGGTIRAARSRRGVVFYGCSNYNAKPKCDYVAWSQPQADQRCTVCTYPLAERVFRGNSQGMKCTNAACLTNEAKARKPAAKTGGRASTTSRSTTATAKSTGRAKPAAEPAAAKATTRGRRTTDQ